MTTRTMPSDTPRTDAAAITVHIEADSVYDEERDALACVEVEFARQLERELAALLQWKTAVLSALNAWPEYTAGAWAGDKSGWGFAFEFINWSRRENATLRNLLDACRAIVGAVKNDEGWQGAVFAELREALAAQKEGK